MVVSHTIRSLPGCGVAWRERGACLQNHMAYFATPEEYDVGKGAGSRRAVVSPGLQPSVRCGACVCVCVRARRLRERAHPLGHRHFGNGALSAALLLWQALDWPRLTRRVRGGWGWQVRSGARQAAIQVLP